MIYLILDTNIWLYLANGFDSRFDKIDVSTDHHIELFQKLKEKNDSGEFTILVNSIIINEWNRNKKRAYAFIKQLEEQKKKLLADLIIQKDTLNTDIFKSLCASIDTSFEPKIRLNQEHIENVEFLIQNSQIIPISDQVKLKVVDLAINKDKAPFVTNKNNFADAVILFSSLEYLQSGITNPLERAVFVSNNYKEFGESANSNNFHPDFAETIINIQIEYHRHLKTLLSLTEDIQTEIDEFHFFIHDHYLYFQCINNSCLPISEEDEFKIVYFNGKVRKARDAEKCDPNQLFLFEMDHIKAIKSASFSHTGCCPTCLTNYVECPTCYNTLAELNENAQFFCMNCDQGFQIDSSLKKLDKIIFPISQDSLTL